MRAFAWVAALLLTACQTTGVHTDFNSAANFTAYQTYHWLPSEAPRGMNPLMFRRVKDSIDRSLTARGYSQSTQGDFAITFTVEKRERTQVDDHGYGWGSWGGHGWDGWGGHGWGGYGGLGAGYPGIDIYTVTQRSIIIDVYDARTGAAAWHGVVSRQYHGRLDRAVQAVLAEFPPQPRACNPATGKCPQWVESGL